MSKSFLDILRDRIVVFDGAMGTNLHAQDLTVDDYGGPQFEGCPEHLLISMPEAVEKVHAGFLEVGCDVLETDSFGSTSIVLAEYQIAHLAYELNVRAAQLAKQVAADFSTPEKPRWVAGSMGPTTKLPTLGHISFNDMKASYRDQARGLLDGGADLLIVETCQDLLQTKSALAAIFEEFTSSKFAVSVIPNAGIPENVGGHAVFKETPESLSKELSHFARDLGVNIVGGCCGTTPAHLRAVVESVRDVRPLKRDVPRVAASSSIFIQQPYRQDTSFLIVGERVNASGSRKMRDLLNGEDWDGLVSLAREQEREGAHVLDVNVDYVGRDGEKDMHELASRLVTNVKIPLMFDSTEWQKMEAGLQHAGGKCILNSTNYEDGEPRFAKVLELAKQ